MTGAVDLSGFKQRAQQNASASAPAGQTASAVPGATEVSEANFENEVLIRSDEVPVVVLLWSPRSDACVQLVETLAQLASQDGGKWSFATVNVDVVPRVAQIFGVEAVPTVVGSARCLGNGGPEEGGVADRGQIDEQHRFAKAVQSNTSRAPWRA